jgi:hypothetical protein
MARRTPTDGWPQGFGVKAAAMRTEADGSNVTDRPAGRPIAQWLRIKAGRDDDLGNGAR